MKKFTFGKNISRGGKIFFSLVLTLALLLSTVVYSSAEGETATDFGGYDTKYTHVYSPMDLLTINTAATSAKLKVHNDDNSYDSSIWKFNVVEKKDGVEVSNVMKTTNRFTNSCITFSGNKSGIASVYNFYGSTANCTSATAMQKHRTIEYVCQQRLEHMALGFTAPQSGIYEIAAPLKSESNNGEAFNYSVVKVDALGNETVLQEQQWYTGQDRFCDLIVELESGDTVWLNARVAVVDTVIDIGIPQAILLKEDAVIKNEEGTTYNFRAIDYLEDSVSNGLQYSIISTTANTKAAWEVGYINDTATVSGGVYNFNNIILPTASDIDTDADATLLSAMKPYELISNGKVYFGLPFREAKEDNTLSLNVGDIIQESTTQVAATGAFYSGSPNLVETTATGYTGKTRNDLSGEYIVGGHFFRFTAPISGSATVNLNSDCANVDFKSSTKLIVLQNNAVKEVYDSMPESPILQLGNVNVGDQITLLYYGFNKNSTKIVIGSPLIEITKTNTKYATITYDANGGKFINEYETEVLEGSTIKLPATEKANAIFKGWTDGENSYKLRAEVTVEGDMHFTALYNYLGDATGDRVLDENDMTKLRRYLLGLESITSLFAEPDANDDGDIDICDLVRVSILLSEKAAS